MSLISGLNMGRKYTHSLVGVTETWVGRRDCPVFEWITQYRKGQAFASDEKSGHSRVMRSQGIHE